MVLGVDIVVLQWWRWALMSDSRAMMGNLAARGCDRRSVPRVFQRKCDEVWVWSRKTSVVETIGSSGCAVVDNCCAAVQQQAMPSCALSLVMHGGPRRARYRCHTRFQASST